MKENIESKYIGNRRFIIELRFEPQLAMLDTKGSLINKIREIKNLALPTFGVIT